MNNLTPGYPLDYRRPEMRARAERGHIGDFEWAAARVVARFTGELVVIQDDNSRDGMVDLRIDYADRRSGYVEVTMDIDPDYSALSAAVRGQRQHPLPNLRRVWSVTLSGKARLKQLTSAAPSLLKSLEQQGEPLFQIVYGEQRLAEHPDTTVRRLSQLGVVQLASRPIRSNEEGRLDFYEAGTGGSILPDWLAFSDSLQTILISDRVESKRIKLAAADGAEKHLFVGTSFSTLWAANHILRDELHDLPPEPPHLPLGITHLWMWWLPVGRCIAWYPETGWLDPSRNWASS